MPGPLIPLHWNVHQAIEVTDFLADIIEAIWDTHGHRMAHHMRRIAAEEHQRQIVLRDAEDSDDEIPF